MKKLFTLSLMLISSSFLYAQEKKVEFRAGYGVVTVPQVLEGISTVLAAGLVPDGYTNVDLSGSGALFASAIYNPDKRFSMGLDLGFERTKSVYNYTNGTSSSLKNSWLSAMVRADYKYINNPGFKLYSALSVGAVSLHSKSDTNGKTENDLNVAFQISPIGFRAGKNLAFWAEAGFGFKGLLTGGLSFKM